MTIEIRQEELETLIRQRMETGAYQTVEDVLLQALKSSSSSDEISVVEPSSRPKKNFAEFLQESPLPGSGLTLDRVKDYPSPVEL